MRPITAFLAILSLWLLSVSPLRSAQTTRVGTSTTDSSTIVHYEEILQVPPITSEYGAKSVEWVAWNPMASNIAAVYEDGHAIRILDSNTGATIQDIAFSDSTVNSSYAWSPDGKHIAALLGVPDNVIKIWSLRESSNPPPTVINRLGHDPHPIYWSPDGLKLSDIQYVNYSSAEGTNVLTIWNTQGGKLISRHDRMTMGAWSPDGKKMVITRGTDHGYTLEIVNPDTFKTLLSFPTTLDEGTYVPYSLWSSDNRQVIGTTCNPSKCTLWNWDAQTGQVTEHFGQIDKNGDPIGDNWIANSIALNASGTLLAAVSLNTVYLWDVESGELLSPLTINEQKTSLSWNHAQDIFVLGRHDGMIQEWRVQRAVRTSTSLHQTESLKQ